jgi:hypothetical protein
MKSIFQLTSELTANEKLTNNQVLNIIGGLRRNRSRKNYSIAIPSTNAFSAGFMAVEETNAAEDDKRRQRPGGGTTTTSPNS